MNSSDNYTCQTDKLKLPAANGFHYVEVSNILFIQGDRNYSRFHTQDKVYHVAKTLKRLEEELQPVFIRIHKSYLVNKKEIQQSFRINGKDWLSLKSKVQNLPISKRYFKI